MSSSTPLIVIDDSSDDEDYGRSLTRRGELGRKSEQGKIDGTFITCSDNDDVDDDDDDSVIEVLVVGQKQSDQQPFAQGQSSSKSSCNDDDVQEIGTVNAVRLPHARHDCPNHAFVQDVLHNMNLSKDGLEAKSGLEANQTTCDMCYCFVCDCIASECKNWTRGGDVAQCISEASCHCLASNQGVGGRFWVGMRDRQKGRTSNTSDMSNDDTNGSTTGLMATSTNAQNEEVDNASSLAPSRVDAVTLSHDHTLNSPALAPVASANEQLRKCSRCYISKPRSGYNRKQWTIRNDNRRCCADCSKKRQHNRNTQEQCGRRCKKCRVRKEQSQYVKAQWRRFTRTGKFDGICRHCKSTRDFQQHRVLPAIRPQQPLRSLSELQTIPNEILVPNPTQASLQATSNYARRDQGRCACPESKYAFDRTTPMLGLRSTSSHTQIELRRKRSRDEYYHHGNDYDDNSSSRPSQRRVTLSPEKAEWFGQSTQFSGVVNYVALPSRWGAEDDQHPSSTYTVPTQLPLQQPLRPAMPYSQGSWEAQATAHVPRQAPLRELSQPTAPPPASIFIDRHL